MTRLLLWLLLATPAFAAPTAALRWTACDGPTNQDFTGPGTFVQVVSASGLSGTVTGLSFEIRVKAPPDAWRFDAAGCNAGNASFTLAASGKSCPVIGTGFILQQQVDYDAPTQTERIRFGALISASASLDPAKSYSLGRIGYDQTGNCSGAELPVCFELVSASYNDANGAEHPFTLGNATASWQNAQCFATLFGGARVEEFLPSCATGDTSAQFIELRSTSDFDRYSSHLKLRVEDHLNAVRYDAGNLFGAALEGQAWPRDHAWLLAASGFVGPADARIPAALDPSGGRITLYDDRPGGAVVQVVDYTPPTPAGSSLLRQPDGTYVPAVPAPDASGQAIPFECPAGNERVFVREFATACRVAEQPFIELEAPVDQRFESNMHLIFRDRTGSVRMISPGLFKSWQDGTTWPAGHSWLIAGSSFRLDTGVTPDYVIDLPQDTEAGTIELWGGPRGKILIDRVDYGAGREAPAPPRGYSVEQTVEGTFALNPTPSPTTYEGVFAGGGCYCPGEGCADAAGSLIRMEQVGFECANGEIQTQYVVFRATGPNQAFIPLELLIFDHEGNEAVGAGPSWPGYALDEPWPEGTAMLSGWRDLPGYSWPVRPDGDVGGWMDPLGGKLVLKDTRFGGQTIQVLEYGPGTAVPAPPRGGSLRMDANGAWHVFTDQELENHAGQRGRIESCPCPTSAIFVGSGPYPYYSVAPAESRTDNNTHGEYDLPAGRAYSSIGVGGFQSTFAEGADLYTLVGPTPGAPVVLHAAFDVHGKTTTTCSAGRCSQGFGEAALRSDSASVVRAYSDDVDTQLALAVNVRVGESWHLRWKVGTSFFSEGPFVSSVFSGQLKFPDVPPGMSIVSCNGFRFDGPTAALPSLATMDATSGSVQLAWSIPSGLEGLTVDRTELGDRWETLGAPQVTGSLARFVDDHVRAGARYGYRLRWNEGQSTGIAWADVPAMRLALRALGSPGTPELEFTLPAPTRVRVELLDLRGRRVSIQDLGVQEAGIHRVPAATLPPGVYWARLLAGDQERRLKLVVVGR